MQSVVMAVFPSPSDASLGLDNLSEANFGPATISLVMRTTPEVADLANASGPLNGLPLGQLTEKLQGLGLSGKDAEEYRQGVLGGGVFIAVSAPPGSESAAEEILKDANAGNVRVVSI